MTLCIEIISVCILLAGTMLQLLKLYIFSQVNVQKAVEVHGHGVRGIHGQETLFIWLILYTYFKHIWHKKFFILSVFLYLFVYYLWIFLPNLIRMIWRGVAVFNPSCKMPCTTFILSFVMTKLVLNIEYE